MGNLCSIFHSRFKNLIKVIPSARKAQLVDYFLLGWQTSTYKLKGSDKKWFMKPYAQIVADTGIPLSTLERYIKELNDLGFIERRQALYSRTKERGEFEVKKGTYIHITEKLLVLLKPSETRSETEAIIQDKDIHTNNNDNHKAHLQFVDEKQPDSSNFENNEGNEPLKMRGLYIRDLYSSSLINTITFKKLTHSGDKVTHQRLIQQFETIENLLCSEVKEEISDEVKKLVLGTFFNLTFEHHKQFSSPKQVASEYLYALLNIDFYLPNVACFKHRNNILSKIIRANNWKTPKGFYKHFYLGQEFKDKQVFRDENWKRQKNKEINQTYGITDEIKDKRLIQLESQMLEKCTLIDELTKNVYQQSSEDMISKIQENIQIARKELEHLWHQQFLIEQEIEQQKSLNYTKRCA